MFSRELIENASQKLISGFGCRMAMHNENQLWSRRSGVKKIKENLLREYLKNIILNFYFFFLKKKLLCEYLKNIILNSDFFYKLLYSYYSALCG